MSQPTPQEFEWIRHSQIWVTVSGIKYRGKILIYEFILQKDVLLKFKKHQGLQNNGNQDFCNGLSVLVQWCCFGKIYTDRFLWPVIPIYFTQNFSKTDPAVENIFYFVLYLEETKGQT